MYPFLSFLAREVGLEPTLSREMVLETIAVAAGPLPYLAVGEGFEPSHRFTGLTR